MATYDLDAIHKELWADGYAIRNGELAEFQRYAVKRGWTPMPQKRGATTTRLKPMTAEDAPPRTLSALYGLESQPLHTDGAHLVEMPDVIVLASADSNDTATLLWKAPNAMPPEVRSGVFTVRGNTGSFLAHAHADGRLRYDPGCMSPGDHLARQAMEFFASRQAEATRHTWQAGTLLIINNRTMLHARDAVANPTDAESRVLERCVFRLESK